MPIAELVAAWACRTVPRSTRRSTDGGMPYGLDRQRRGAHEIAEHNRELAAVRLVYSERPGANRQLPPNLS
jgi:hypothetical protein